MQCILVVLFPLPDKCRTMHLSMMAHCLRGWVTSMYNTSKTWKAKCLKTAPSSNTLRHLKYNVTDGCWSPLLLLVLCSKSWWPGEEGNCVHRASGVWYQEAVSMAEGLCRVDCIQCIFDEQRFLVSNLQYFTIVRVEAHKPSVLPALQFVKVCLKGSLVFWCSVSSVREAVICKVPGGLLLLMMVISRWWVLRTGVVLKQYPWGTPDVNDVDGDDWSPRTHWTF